MQVMRCLREADQAALEAYAQARERGVAHHRALSTAILRWVARCDCVDGREARARVVEVLLRTRTMGPRDYEDWVVVALGKDVWDSGAPAAIHRLSIDCRTLEGDEVLADRQQEFEQIGADELRDYLRLELPRKVRRLRLLARELLPVGGSRDGT
jgi:hypothetical protein